MANRRSFPREHKLISGAAELDVRPPWRLAWRGVAWAALLEISYIENLILALHALTYARVLVFPILACLTRDLIHA